MINTLYMLLLKKSTKKHLDACVKRKKKVLKCVLKHINVLFQTSFPSTVTSETIYQTNLSKMQV